eukprot:TRINITY_DN16169_c0_g2_i1.p2 TRINITY_DN16169_c0_g2~~TRINITY_DN16169_c0_g2_i1.p2  ORF type:complete len:176 (-),score=16.91 TRINITY_DN16169_c0_g2_i1:261-788(-)
MQAASLFRLKHSHVNRISPSSQVFKAAPILPQKKQNLFVRQAKDELQSLKNVEGEAAVDQAADNLTKVLYPVLQNMGFSGVCGFSVAIALKVVGSALATLFGLAFITIQALAYFEIIDVNWGKIESKGIQFLDQNQDGKLDEEDLKLFLKNNMSVLSVGVPSVGGFLFGLILGLR